MATLSYTLYDYVNVPTALVDVDPAVATSDATLVLSTTGPFPNSWWLNDEGQWEGGELDGALYVSIDGVYLGRVFSGPPGAETTGYFEPGPFESYVTATIPRDIWRSVIADGEIELQFEYGLDAEALADPDDLIRVEVNWLEYYNGVRGSPDADVIVVDQPTIIEGRGGNDDITGSGYGDIIMGGTGDDDIDGAGGQDTIRGGDGADHIWGGTGDDLLWGGNDRDLIFGNEGSDRLRGDAGNDDLDGSGGNDYIWGGDGDDRLLGRTGENHLFGGAGADEFTFTHSDGAAIQHVYDFDRSAGDRLVFIQAFDQVIDDYGVRVGKDGTVVTIADTTIVLSGVFDLSPSDFTFLSDSDWPWEAATLAASGPPPVEIIRGTDDYDELHSEVPAIMIGLGGDDWITGSDGGDILNGGAGADQLYAGEGDNIVRGGDGADITGTGDGQDYHDGGTGNDELWAGGGDDTLVGGAGHDQLWGQAGNDTERGGDGLDNLMGGDGDDKLSGGNDRDWLYGEAGSDHLRGDAGNDDLSGGDGGDYLWGGEGADRLWGGQDSNHLWGGGGADQFMFHYSDTTGTQYIHDFDRAAGDTIVYGPDWDQVVGAGDIDIRAGKDGSVVTIGDTTVVVSGVFDLTVSDITIISDGYWPWEV